MNTHDPIVTTPVSPPSAVKRRRSTYAWISFIFLCGVLTGAALGVMGLHVFMSYRFRHPEEMYVRVLERAERGLNLTPEQQRQIHDILQSKQAEFSNILDKEFPARVDAHFDALRDEVANVLDAKQAAAWRQRFEEMRARSLPPFPPPPKGRPGSHAEPG